MQLKMIRFSGTLLFILSLFTSTILLGQNPVNWTFSVEKISDKEANLVFRGDIKQGWYTYSQYTEDNGPIPTEISFEEQAGIKLLGKSVEFGDKKEGMDPLFEAYVIKYSSKKPFIIKQKVSLIDLSKPVTGYISFMTCNDETCLPPKDVDFSFQVSDLKDKMGAATDKSVTTEAVASTEKKKIEIVAAPEAISINPVSGLSTSPTNQPVKWSFHSEKLSDKQIKVTYTASLQDGWFIYSQFTEDNGPIPTAISYDDQNEVKLIENTETGDKKEGKDPLFEVNVIKFSSKKEFVITQIIEPANVNKEIRGFINYMSCNDEVCTPPMDHEFILNGDNAASSLASAPLTDGNTIDQRIPALYNSYKNNEGQCGAEIKSAENTGLLWTFLFGFGGGLLALLTPCVFPMIPITVSFFTKDTKRKGWVNGLLYGGSIVGIYVALGLLVTMVFGAEALNRLSTNWIANSLFFLVFIVFAFSFFGFYELTLPSSWTTKTDKMADKGGFIGIFFMAFTLALVSFSCTGPIVGTALVQAATKGAFIGPLTVMLGFSLALALPFGLFAAFPAWLNSLPKSGSWMNSVKVVLGFLELALAFKFLSVADMTNHWGFLRYEIFVGIWVVVFALMSLYLFGFIRFPHDSPLKALSKTRIAFGLVASLATIYLLSGFMIDKQTQNYNALKLMSGLAPPAHYNYFLKEQQLNQNIADKYPSYTKCAQGIDCFKDYYEGLAYARESGKPLLLDFTGYGCVNCRKTEEHIWVDDRVRKILMDEVVLVSLYGDDDYPTDESMQNLRSKYTGQRMRNVGKVWADFQMANFETNAQPLYIMVSPDQKLITNPRPYQEGVNDYLDFLECGLSSYGSSSLSKM